MIFNSIKNVITKNTGLLLRMDDIAENMNWELMDKCEILFDNFNLKPLLGVIPANKDPELLKYPRNHSGQSETQSIVSGRATSSTIISGTSKLVLDNRSIAANSVCA